MDPSYNSFGSFDLNGGQPITSGAAMPVDDKKKKQKLIIGIVLVIAVLLVIVIVGLFASGKIGYSSEKKYLNYVVNGNENDNKNVGEEYSSLRPYYFDEVINSDNAEEFEGFYNKAKSLLDKISDKKDIVSLQKDYLEMFKVQYEIAKYNSGESMAELYLSGGEDAMNEEIMVKIRSIDFEKDARMEKYVDSMDAWVNGIIAIVDLYRNAGCTGETIKALNECALSAEKQVSMSILNNAAIKAEDDVIDAAKDMYRYFVMGAYRLIAVGSGDETE